MSGHLNQQELESYLWGAATLLRGLVNATDYKQFIFPCFSSNGYQMFGVRIINQLSKKQMTRGTLQQQRMTVSQSLMERVGKMFAA